MRLAIMLVVVFVAGCAAGEYGYVRDSGGEGVVLPSPIGSYRQGQTIYSEDECIGAVVNGVCYGTIMPKPRYHETCYGVMQFGRCIGSQF